MLIEQNWYNRIIKSVFTPLFATPSATLTSNLHDKGVISMLDNYVFFLIVAPPKGGEGKHCVSFCKSPVMSE